MTTLTDKIIEAGFTDRILTDVDLSDLLDGTPASRYGMLNKAFNKKELIKIRRGLYMLSEKYRRKKLSKFFLANQILPHSYISLESALSYHGWIPERVSTITSVFALGRTKKFITPLGEFVYYQLPFNEYEFLTGVTRVEEIKNEPFLLASPLRALADYIYVKKITWKSIADLTNNLRIDIENLLKINPAHFVEINNVYRSKRVLHFLENLKKELKK